MARRSSAPQPAEQAALAVAAHAQHVLDAQRHPRCWCCCWATNATRVPGATVIVPDVGRTSPASRLSSVLLPLPLGPTSAVDVPARSPACSGRGRRSARSGRRRRWPTAIGPRRHGGRESGWWSEPVDCSVLGMILSPSPARVTTALVGGGCSPCAACGGDDAGGGRGRRPYVVATTGIWADIAGTVACDGSLDVRTIAAAGRRPPRLRAVAARPRGARRRRRWSSPTGSASRRRSTTRSQQVEDGGVPVFRVGDHVETLGGTDRRRRRRRGRPATSGSTRPGSPPPCPPSARRSSRRAPTERRIDDCVADRPGRPRRPRRRARGDARRRPGRPPRAGHQPRRARLLRRPLRLQVARLGPAVDEHAHRGQPGRARGARRRRSRPPACRRSSPRRSATPTTPTPSPTASASRSSSSTRDALGEPGSGADTYAGLLRTDAERDRRRAGLDDAWTSSPTRGRGGSSRSSATRRCANALLGRAAHGRCARRSSARGSCCAG